VARLAIPLPTLMPSYNQIGFDSLHYVVGVVEAEAGHGVGWMAGGRLLEGGAVSVDPATKALFPLDLAIDGDRLTLQNQEGLSVEIMNATLPFKTFRMAVRLAGTGDAAGPAVLSGSTICAEVPFYGPFLQTLGLCNPQTDVVRFFGGANFVHAPKSAAPSGVGDVTFDVTAGAVTATIAGGALRASEHLAGILLVDAVTGKPVTLGYGLETKRTADPSGVLTSVTIPLAGHAVPKSVRAYLMIDSAAAAKATLAIP
jgi:hypothetical protein